MEHAGILKKIAVRIALRMFKRRLFVKHTVKDYLWGYNDSLMTAFTNRTKFGLFVGVRISEVKSNSSQDTSLHSIWTQWLIKS